MVQGIAIIEFTFLNLTKRLLLTMTLTMTERHVNSCCRNLRFLSDSAVFKRMMEKYLLQAELKIVLKALTMPMSLETTHWYNCQIWLIQERAIVLQQLGQVIYTQSAPDSTTHLRLVKFIAFREINGVNSPILIETGIWVQLWQLQIGTFTF